MKQLDDFVQLLGLVLIVINAILFTRSYISNRRNVALLYIFLYLFIGALIMVISSVLGYLSEDNIYLAHFYFISQFICLSLFYRSLFNAHQRRVVVVILYLVLIALGVQYFSDPELIFNFNLFEIFITSFPLVVYSIVHLYNSLSKKGQYMYLNSGVLIYITSSTLIFILGNYLHEVLHKDSSIYIWFINKVLYVVYLLLILVEWKKLTSLQKNKS